jgi:hypothetical protein
MAEFAFDAPPSPTSEARSTTATDNPVCEIRLAIAQPTTPAPTMMTS